MITLTPDQLSRLQSILNTLSRDQLIWVSGYLWGLINVNRFTDTTVSISTQNQVSSTKQRLSQLSDKIIIISASQTGNASQIAQKLYNDCIKSGLNATLFNARDYTCKNISEIKLLVLIISTYGEGDPPEEAIPLHKYLFSQKAMRMEDTSFVVLGLGDRSYEYFAKAGKDFDRRFEELGAIRLYNRVDLDIDFEDAANIWRKEIIEVLQNRISSDVTIFNSFSDKTIQKSAVVSSENCGDYSVYCKEFPFIACLSNRQKITSRNSMKDIHHLEFDISGSNLLYQPGDALGVWYENDYDLINELLELLKLTGDEWVNVKGQSMILCEALKDHYELTQNTSIFVEKIATITKNKMLLDLMTDRKKLKIYVLETPIIEMIRNISPDITLTAQNLLLALRSMRPRFYSISSAQLEVGEEIHITVSAVRYRVNGRLRSGGASSYLVDRLKENDKLRIFVEPNHNFRLPSDFSASIVMIGAGTGIAPFRAFMQHRVLNQATGRNWLFFGNLRFIDDFLYQTEWQRYVKEGVLSNIRTAWSRDQDHKVYIQNKILEDGSELWDWIEEGAYIYVCGDAKGMAHDVEKALISLTSKYGNMSTNQANDFWDTMRTQHRYQRDVY
ncbi:sulfite reductase [NADPH] flavoprotein, alpha-component [Candidatus Blochmanniella vafra str. BVAF]|uniref:Sulfite reductase [NADPH] flavoprotein alpha-component n=1 Tax=Blochmanniella vafra (strain BVAF) TaxID=859654 RepID=E8Q5R9_BLOVB|nr:assimilatory sulfite reductase (NADPH) flavoprotein subunit [Candidatus Blochmannia vafer]ADV33566.1 sulfite reductase [NADPH] flavoprotein, alpha-component [Candidatus Blochmannia vafer str. BVAF]